jgi:hypothetical protein
LFAALVFEVNELEGGGEPGAKILSEFEPVGDFLFGVFEEGESFAGGGEFVGDVEEIESGGVGMGGEFGPGMLQRDVEVGCALGERPQEKKVVGAQDQDCEGEEEATFVFLEAHGGLEGKLVKTVISDQ